MNKTIKSYLLWISGWCLLPTIIFTYWGFKLMSKAIELEIKEAKLK